MKRRIAKKTGIILLIFCLAAGVFSPANTLPVFAASQTAKKAAVKNGWIHESVGWCYYAKGKKLTNTWKTINNKRYYLGPDGARKTNCWYTIKCGKKYYAYKFNAQGVFVRKSGNYKSIEPKLVKKLDSIISSRHITYKKPKEDTILNLYRLVRDKYTYSRTGAVGFHPSNAKKGWEYQFAQEMLTKKKGSCFHYAAAFALLVKRATGADVRIGLGTAQIYNKGTFVEHGWVEIKLNGKWYTYDPLVDQNKGKRKGLTYKLYKLPSSTAATYYKKTKYVDVII